jgi:hypothetical protein
MGRGLTAERREEIAAVEALRRGLGRILEDAARTAGVSKTELTVLSVAFSRSVPRARGTRALPNC